MNEQLKGAFTRLEAALARMPVPDLPSIDCALADIVALQDPDCISALLTLLDDAYPFQEVLFSLVHAIETIEPVAYAREIAKSLLDLFRRSPEWANIILIRILNCPTTVLAFSNIAATLDTLQMQSLRQLIEEVCTSNPDASAASEFVLKSL